MNGIRCAMIVPLDLNIPGGGIGRLVSYLLREAQNSPQIHFSVHATRLSRTFPTNMLSTPLQYLRIRGRLIRERYDIVHIHVAPKGSTWRKNYYARVAKNAGSTVVLHLHGSGYDEFYATLSEPRKKLVRELFRSADRVIALGESWQEFIVKILGVSSERVAIINNGVPDLPIADKTSSDTPRLMFAGLVGHRKGVDILLTALSRLPKDYRWHCLICGNGDIDKYRAMAKELGLLPDDITFAGWQDEEGIRAHMRNCDLFVLPSRAENQPVAILEAMASGLPVISTRIGDIPNQVIDGKTGLIVTPSDPDELAAALARLIASPDERRRFGASGRQRFLDHFSLSAMLESTLRLYREALAERTGAP